MKKRILALLLSGLLCMNLAGTAFASQWEERFDENGNSLGWFEVGEPDPTPPPVVDPDPDVPDPGPGPDDPTPPTPPTPVYPDYGDDDYNDGTPDAVTPGSPTYTVGSAAGTDPDGNGSWTTDKSNAKKGDTVTITVKPNEGYEGQPTVTDKNGNKIDVQGLGNNKFSFVMPGSAVTIQVEFVPLAAAPEQPAQPEQPAAPVNPFTDVAQSAYYYDAVLWAVEKGITTGTSETTFSPETSCTRAQIVTFLWRAAGSPVMGAANPFTDVPAGAYYADAVAWAVANGITTGTSAATFSPEQTCTRAQAVTFLHRANGSPAVSANSTFTDVPADAYYAGAVAWAVANNITTGTSDTTFSPNADCTRAQIVTFLYRAMAD